MEWVFQLVIIYLGICLVPVFVGSCVLAMERGDPIRVSRNDLSWMFREWAAHVLVLMLLPVGILGRRPRKHILRNKQPDQMTQAAVRLPILLVHGYGLNRACWLFFQTYLHTRGWPWVWAINHRPRSRPIPSYAESLSSKIDLLMAEAGADQVDVVAHSMGGIVTAWYMTQLHGDQRVRRLITLGTPWRGTRTHVFGLRREARDLAPDAQVIQDIQGIQGDIVSIWSDTDHLVIPNDSATHPNLKNIQIPYLGHLEMMISARVFRTVADALAQSGEE